MKNLVGFVIFISIILTSCQDEPHKLYILKSSKETGIEFNNKIIETDTFNILTQEYIFNGGGVAIADFDQNGTSDLYFTGNQVSNRMYLNKGNFEFIDISKIAGVDAADRWSTGVSIVDINNDNWPDIYVCAAMSENKAERANLLFVHQGLNDEGIPLFKNEAERYGIAETGNSMGATFFDYNNDGFLDLYVLNNQQVHELPTNYRKKVTDGTAISNDRLYKNNGNGTFKDVTLEAGIIIEGFGLSLAVSDLNYDGWQDLYVSNDYLTNDLLYINNQDGTFSNSIKSQIKHQSKFSMGSDISDYNNDGILDIVTLDMLGETNYRMKTTIGNNNYISYTLNKRWDYEPQYTRNMLQLGNGPGIPYSEIGLLAGMARTDWSWCPLFMDVDNDGYRDLLITNGFPRDITDKDFGDFNVSSAPYLSPGDMLDSIPTVKIPNYAFRNNADRTFDDVSKAWGLDIPSFSNGASFADLDNDGDLDYVVNNINEEAFIFENTQNNALVKNHFIKLKFKGAAHNKMGIGTKIKINYPDGGFQFYEHHLTRGYMSSVEPKVHFGLGNRTKVKSVQVLWPDGKFQELNNLDVDSTISILYVEAKKVSNTESIAMPPKTAKPYLNEISGKLGIDYQHQEKDVNDYSVQRVLPHKLTQNGPCLAVGDIDSDGNEDFIVGSSAGFSPVIFFQKPDGTFVEKMLFEQEDDKTYEEEGMALFDLENDGDLDLYLVSGSNEFEADSHLYHDRLFVNDGKGNFSAANEKMPDIVSSGSVVKAADFDGDGFTDLFVGGRTAMAQYPYPDKSFLLKNNSGKLEDVTGKLAPKLGEVGMVTDATWSDVDNDGKTDLIVVGEFMPITVFTNKNGVLEKQEATGLENYLGWWECIESADYDHDGDVDFFAGNLGSNNFYNPSMDRPVKVLAKDFDGNGSVDPVMSSYFKNRKGDYSAYPVPFWGDLSGQSPLFRSKFNYYSEYANTVLDSLFAREELEGASELIGNFDRTSYIENLGKGKFRLSALPLDAQLAPINDILITDVDQNGDLDVLLVGNDFGNETFIGRYDAFNGLMLRGNSSKKVKFEPIKTWKSGFLVPGDAKAITSIQSVSGDTLYIVTQNRGRMLMFKTD